jgi:hypothetical protein
MLKPTVYRKTDRLDARDVPREITRHQVESRKNDNASTATIEPDSTAAPAGAVVVSARRSARV